MCLIIKKEPGFEVPFEKFKTAVLNNPDGYGLSYPEDGKLIVEKSVEEIDVDSLYRLLTEDLSEKQVMLHLRYTTVGDTNLRNAHPFSVLEKRTDGVDLRVSHNGTLHPYKQIAKKGESDTRAFTRVFLRPLFKRLIKGSTIKDILSDSFIKSLIENRLNSRSVLTFLDGDGNSLICHEEGNGGKQEKGWYYSNTYSFDPKHRVKPTVSAYPYAYEGYYGGQHTNNVYKHPSSYHSNYNNRSKKAPYYSSQASKIFRKDTNVELFTKKYGVSFEDLFSLSDELIKEIVKDDPKEAVQLIQELLFRSQELVQSNQKLNGQLKFFKEKQKKK